ALKKDTHDLQGCMQHLTKKVHHMDSYLVRLDAQLSSAPMYQSVATFTQSSTPLTLTAAGEDLVKDSGFLDVLAHHQGIFDGILANANGRVDIEAFIEKEAFQKVEELFEENNVMVSQVSQFMYEQGMRQSLDMYQGAIRAFAVAARDAMFKRVGIMPPVAKQNRIDD
ncbi:MAG: hypothetical protein Q9M10_08020, partial [Mariprofundaceae bacterium]|nr:hypothetical protein [Mariprofundaceae bacterium]